MIALANADSKHIPLRDKTVQCVVTSPPYWGLRSYNTGDNKHLEIGAEPTPALYVASIVAVMREVWRVLRDDGVLFLNLGDSYAGSGKGQTQNGCADPKQPKLNGMKLDVNDVPPGLKPKDLVGIPWRVAFALQDDGWYLRSDIIWHKPNPMPESVTDRPTKAHEYVFLLTKSARYYYDAEAVREDGPTYHRSAGGYTNQDINGEFRTRGGFAKNDVTTVGRNRRSVWTVATSPYSGAHYATFPPALVEPMILAGTSQRGQCPHCGMAWARVTEHTNGIYRSSGRADQVAYGDDKGRTRTRQSKQSNVYGTQDVPPSTTTIGWTQQCDCQPADPVPQIVLDPFAGSGTVLEVARKLGRSAIGLDLSETYLTENAMPRGMNTNTQKSMSTLPLFAA